MKIEGHREMIDRTKLDSTDLESFAREMHERYRARLHKVFGPEVGDRFAFGDGVLEPFFDGEGWDGWKRPLELARAWKERQS